ncbi:oxidoreductase [Mycetocola lacteus]|uniref:Oxidoreductase n=1 Tax=Mycetocola lacteus TaxID=76637 RepID=A0A3L7AQL0_9MICO|nr:aldo/keto reductase [Mycetocola lacteus]RLP82245.1 oxidoreductase [Mycetocola lacteus]
MSTPHAAGSGTFLLGGDLPVTRLGYGTMQLTGPGVWGEPADPDTAIAVLRRAAEQGVTLFDTADSYGPSVTERLIREALHPYRDEIVIATKAGFTRQGPGEWTMLGQPAYLRQQVEMSLRILGLDRIDLFQLHRIDPNFPLADQLGVLDEMRVEGKIRHIGLSEVSVDQVRAASDITRIASVQNLYNLSDRSAEDLLSYAEATGIGFIPWFPLATGKLAGPDSPLAQIAETHGATPAQLALAWLLHRSPAMLPIPGTSSLAHLDSNNAAADISLDADEMAALSALS